MRHSIFALLVMVLLTSPALGQESTMADWEEESRYWTLAAHFESVGFPFTFHRGLSFEYSPNDDWSLGLLYSEASLSLGAFGIDLASIKETLKIFEARFFPGPTSFHFPFGIGQRLIRARLGNELLSKASGTSSHLEALTIRQNLIHAGIGNRWYGNSGFTFGVDWIQLYIPVGNSQVAAPFLDGPVTEDAKDDVERALAVMEYVPDLSLMRLHAGYTF